MSASHVMNGQCLCGAVKLSFSVSEKHFDVCHCGMCRKWNGSPAMSVSAGSEVKIEGQDSMQIYSSSEWAERAFCKKCGTHLFYRFKQTGFTSVQLGILDKADELNFHLQIYTDMKPANYSFANKTEMMTEAEVIAKFLVAKATSASNTRRG